MAPHIDRSRPARPGRFDFLVPTVASLVLLGIAVWAVAPFRGGGRRNWAETARHLRHHEDSRRVEELVRKHAAEQRAADQGGGMPGYIWSERQLRELLPKQDEAARGSDPAKAER
jgi:hypothetical protein